jgi:hypothetical protein
MEFAKYKAVAMQPGQPACEVDLMDRDLRRLACAAIPLVADSVVRVMVVPLSSVTPETSEAAGWQRAC